MRGEMIRCPHCDCKISSRDVEKEEGICPECGQPLVMANSLFDEYDEGEDDDRDLDTLNFGNDDEDYSFDDEDEDGYEDDDDEDLEAEFAPRRSSGRRRRSSDDY